MRLSDATVLRCSCARCGIAKYSAVKAIKPAGAVKAFVQNLLDLRTTEQVLKEDTYIRAERFDWQNESKPLKGQPAEEHEKFIADWQALDLMGLYGFPLWEKEVHDTLQKNYAELTSIFSA